MDGWNWNKCIKLFFYTIYKKIMTFNKGTHQAKTKIETLKIRLVGKIVIKILKFNTCKQYLKDGCHGWYYFIQRLTTFHETHVIQNNISYNPNLWTDGKGDSGQQQKNRLNWYSWYTAKVGVKHQSINQSQTATRRSIVHWL